MRIPLLTPLWGIDPGPWLCGPIGRMGSHSLYSFSFFMVHLVNLWRVDIYQAVCRRVAGMCWWPQFMVTSSPITKWLAYCHVQPEKKYLCGALQTNTRDRRFNQSNIYSQSNNNNWFGSERAVIHKHNHKTRPSRFNTMLGSLVSIIKQWIRMESTPIQETPYWKFHGSKLSQS